VSPIGSAVGGEAPPLDRLLRRTAAGDRAAFAALYAQTAAKLFGLALRIMRQREAAEKVI
jgi:RNA polymerase sigma-70 factor, ECF subfamily